MSGLRAGDRAWERGGLSPDEWERWQTLQAGDVVTYDDLEELDDEQRDEVGAHLSERGLELVDVGYVGTVLS